MSAVKYLFSILLISGGIVILSKVVPSWINMLLWSIFLIGLSVLGGVLSPRSEEVIRHRVWKLIMVLVLLTGVFLFFRALESGPLAGHPRSVSPGEPQVESLPWETRLGPALEEAARANKIIMVDTFTDWCTVCKKLEEKTFQNLQVQEKLKNMVLVKIDFTRETPQNLQLKERYQIIGFPTVLFLNSRGEVLDRFSTFMDKTAFLKRLDILLQKYSDG
jgi:thiol:disulfide interchange protein DsbD